MVSGSRDWKSGLSGSRTQILGFVRPQSAAAQVNELAKSVKLTLDAVVEFGPGNQSPGMDRF